MSIVSYFIKWVPTSWTYSTREKCINNQLSSYSFHLKKITKINKKLQKTQEPEFSNPDNYSRDEDPVIFGPTDPVHLEQNITQNQQIQA